MPEPNLKDLDLRRIGTTGLQVSSGWVYEEELRELHGERGRKVFKEMRDNDPVIGGIMLGIEFLARQVAWTVKPADDSAKSETVAEFIDGALTDMQPSWGNTLSEIMSMIVFGWSWLEIVYKKREGLDVDSQRRSSHFDDGKIGWSGWHIRSQDTLFGWEYENKDGTGELKGMTQQAYPSYRTTVIPRNKSLHFTTRSNKENPEGRSLLRNAYRPWYFKNNIEKIEGIGIERDLAGLPVLWAPPELFSATASDEDRALFDQLQKLVTSIKRDEQEGILMPLAYSEDGKNKLYELELLATGGDRQFDTNAIINRYDERMAMSMLADFILMGHQSVGSYALSTTKTGLFSSALSAMLDIVSEEINTAAIPRLVLLNGWSLKHVPSLQHGKIEAADLGKLGEFLKQLYSAGMQVFPNPALESFVMQAAGLPSDEGAGELPLPVLDENGNVIPLQLPNMPAGVVPTGAAKQPPNPGATTTSATPGGARSPGAAAAGVKARRGTQATKMARPADRRQRAATGRVAAGEPVPERRKPKHFVPLAQRVAKLDQAWLMDELGDDYTVFLTAVMQTGKFSELPEEYQEVIEVAETEAVE